LPIYQTVIKNREEHSLEEFVEGLSHFDKEGNGFISIAELRHLLTTLGKYSQISSQLNYVVCEMKSSFFLQKNKSHFWE